MGSFLKVTKNGLMLKFQNVIGVLTQVIGQASYCS